MRVADAAGMILRQFFERRLAQYSFLVGCTATGRALVIDPTRRIDQYVEAANAEGLQITGVAETHIHADFASGAAALARRADAILYVSAEGGADWQYAFADVARARLLRHGDVFHVGRIRLDTVHTPGHTPEHLTFLVTDETVAPHAIGAFTGDFLFPGDVGRPDLLEAVAGESGSADLAARRLYAAVRAFGARPDRLLVWPGHGAGSACGKTLGGMPVTTLGYEKLTNWAYQVPDGQTFVTTVLADQPDPPRYFREMKRLNRRGAAPARVPARLRQVALPDLAGLVTAHAEFIDIRPEAGDTGFLPGSLLLPLTAQFVAMCGSVARYGMPVYLVSAAPHDAVEAADGLSLIGLDDVRGWIPASALPEYCRLGGVLERLVEIDAAAALQRQAAGHLLLDVRTTSEWNTGRIPEAVHAPLTRLVDCVRELDRDTPLIVYCEAGVRSRVAAAALRRVGFRSVASLAGGFTAYRAMRAGGTVASPLSERT